MILVADEGVDRAIVDRLRADGHEVIYIAELAPSIDDDEVLARANASQALLLTLDKDFGDLVYRQRRVHGGVILARLAGLEAYQKADLVASAFAEHGGGFVDAFVVITPRAVRIRRSS